MTAVATIEDNCMVAYTLAEKFENIQMNSWAPPVPHYSRRHRHCHKVMYSD